MTAPKPWEMAAAGGEEARATAAMDRPGSPEYRAAMRAVETKAYRWLLARLSCRAKWPTCCGCPSRRSGRGRGTGHCDGYRTSGGGC
jgi:hypothetical protein